MSNIWKILVQEMSKSNGSAKTVTKDYKEWIAWLNYEPEFEKQRKKYLMSRKFEELNASEQIELSHYIKYQTYADLFNKYENSNISQVEKEQLVEKDMSIWRQEQTGSKVTGLASSSIAERQSNISDLSTRYMNKYNMDKNDADTLANLKEELNFLKEHNGTSSEFNSVSNRLSVIENKYNINLRKNMASSVGDSGISSVYSEQSNSNITTIPYNGTEQTQNLESNTPYNTVPIGLGIAASGIAGAIGAVIIDDKKTKNKKRKPNRVYSDDGDIELEGEYRDNSLENASFASETRTTLQDLDIDYADNQRYRASSRDKDNLDKFYDETDDFFYKDDDE